MSPADTVTLWVGQEVYRQQSKSCRRKAALPYEKKGFSRSQTQLLLTEMIACAVKKIFDLTKIIPSATKINASPPELIVYDAKKIRSFTGKIANVAEITATLIEIIANVNRLGGKDNLLCDGQMFLQSKDN